MKRLSEKLAELSVQAKNTEDRVVKAQAEGLARIEQQREHVRQQAEEALGKVKQRLDVAKGDASIHFDALKSKVGSDFEEMRQRASETKDKFEAWQSDNYAIDKEADALAAIDYAVAATIIAELQTLDAIAARAEANSRAEQTQSASTMA